jgi:gentisate 1,2-dioxygenase
MFLDFIFQRYHWNIEDYLILPEYRLHELNQVWAAEGAMIREDKPVLEGQALIDEARAQGFDLPPNM